MRGRAEAEPDAAAAAMFTLGSEALRGVSQAGPESDGVVGGFAAGRQELEVVRGVEGGAEVAAVVVARGGEEGLGVSPVEGDGARTSSTGLFVLLL